MMTVGQAGLINTVNIDMNLSQMKLKKEFLIRAVAALAIVAIFMFAYFNDRKLPSGGAVVQDNQESETPAETAGNPGNIGTSEGDGTVAPLEETEIGQSAASGAGEDLNNSLSTEKVCFGDKCYVAEIAITPQEHARGLMFRESLGKDRGMIFDFGSDGIHKFWMKNTKINLDMVWIGSDKKVIFISNNILPCIRDVCPQYGPDIAARYVLEVNGGEMARLGVKIGDTVTIK